jgi:thioredoxin reductase (NADPH)
LTNWVRTEEPLFEVWGRPNCVWCNRAKELIDERGLQYIYKELDETNIEQFKDYFPDKKTVPQIIVEEYSSAGWYPRVIGGYEQLVEYLK